jgi:hypothetical protein
VYWSIETYWIGDSLGFHDLRRAADRAAAKKIRYPHEGKILEITLMLIVEQTQLVYSMPRKQGSCTRAHIAFEQAIHLENASITWEKIPIALPRLFSKWKGSGSTVTMVDIMNDGWLEEGLTKIKASDSSQRW